MYKHLLLPMDGSPSSESAARSGARLARELNAKITALHVEATARPRAEAPLPRAGAAPHGMLDYARRVAQAAGVECDVVCERGDHPYQVIVDCAQRLGCDLIVMASHRRGTLEALLFGSQTQHVLARCGLPVLVVS
ncbi:universal stress protein [Tahibacter caeni]|uniref:universal stress protein n=1 Tax=Tahibacter caeni TaxID=1453545 RepID=UPI00214720FE|nr:universal stress protein [Tahibacter caeni]